MQNRQSLILLSRTKEVYGGHENHFGAGGVIRGNRGRSLFINGDVYTRSGVTYPPTRSDANATERPGRIISLHVGPGAGRVFFSNKQIN